MSVAVSPSPSDPVAQLSHSTLWGLVRSARNEHPERSLRLVDLECLHMDAQAKPAETAALIRELLAE